ncbi:hypothetical protein FHR97_002144 [Halomonas stenophila]|uniref:Uncharacterized protein n=1 Tax=Halomonas stenophila TaxID=795312 RepID=A0A7W5ETQ1_9GAMM|nr:hypothetical protein [Halomonas stenophila]
MGFSDISPPDGQRLDSCRYLVAPVDVVAGDDGGSTRRLKRNVIG